jgi:HD-GYP domain-containing protein (c-di-GMP phosphodiesterase class II)
MLAALTEIREHAGTQFCPRVVAALEELWRKEPGVFAATVTPLPSPSAATDAA